MAIDKLVDSAQLDADLTSVANAIRTKGGTSAQLSFPSGFVSAINAIQTGGGGITADQIAERTISGIVEGDAETIYSLAFYNCSQITGVSFPNAVNIGSQAFLKC